MSAPFEIVAAPLTVYLAPVGTAFPDVSDTPSGTWIKLGTSGDKNYDEDGVTVAHEQNLEVFRPAGGAAPRKVWRTEEDLSIGFTLVDISADQYAKVLNDASVTTVAAAADVAGADTLDLMMGRDVALFAMIARGVSPADDQYAAQYQVPICYQSESPEPAYKKGEPAGLEIKFMALEDDTLGFGKLVIQTAAPTS
jgi:hypothetical protein